MNGASGSRVEPRRPWQRFALDLLLLTVLGLLLSELGPYRTIDAPVALRRTYWLLAVIGSGLAGVLVDAILGPRVRKFWTRVVVVSAVATPPVTLFIYALNASILDLPRRPWLMPQLA